MSDFLYDSNLIQKALAGDTEAFATLCERYRVRVWRIVTSVARGPDADDLAQEAIVRAYCSLRTYRAEASFEAWLCRIALNAAHDYHRSAWRRRVVCGPDVHAVCDPSDESPEGMAARREIQRKIRQAVAVLPEHQRAPIWLHFFEEFSVAEISRLEHVPESTIRSRVQAGLRRLSRLLIDLPAAGEGIGRIETEAKGYSA